MPSTTIRVITTLDGTTLFDKTKTIPANTRQLFNPANGVPTGTTALPILGVAFPLDDLLSCEITTDQAITLYTNSATGAGGQVIALGIDDVIAWAAGGQIANPFTVAVTALYITNASGFTANVKISFEVDSD